MVGSKDELKDLVIAQGKGKLLTRAVKISRYNESKKGYQLLGKYKKKWNLKTYSGKKTDWLGGFKNPLFAYGEKAVRDIIEEIDSFQV